MSAGAARPWNSPARAAQRSGNIRQNLLEVSA